MHPHKSQALRSHSKKAGGLCEGYKSGGNVGARYHQEDCQPERLMEGQGKPDMHEHKKAEHAARSKFGKI